MTKSIRSKITRGSCELAILSLLEGQSLYGFEIAKKISERTGGRLKFTLASLYPLLYEMERRGWVEAHWRENAAGRDRRYYRLTPTGSVNSLLCEKSGARSSRPSTHSQDLAMPNWNKEIRQHLVGMNLPPDMTEE